jgi:hypothetical protein
MAWLHQRTGIAAYHFEMTDVLRSSPGSGLGLLWGSYPAAPGTAARPGRSPMSDSNILYQLGLAPRSRRNGIKLDASDQDINGRIVNEGPGEPDLKNIRVDKHKASALMKLKASWLNGFSNNPPAQWPQSRADREFTL